MNAPRPAAIAALIAAFSPQLHAAPETTLSEVVATDQREAETLRKEAPLQKIVISEEEVERFGDATVGDILKRLPGISFTGPAGVTKDVRMRGLDKGYTQFTINGEAVPGATKDRQMQVDRLPADMIERIEIIRNPSAAYDAGNVGGIVNIVFKSRIDEVTRLRASAGRNGELGVGDVIAQTSKRFDNLDVLLAVSYTEGAEDVVEQKTTFSPTTGAVTGTEYKPKPAEKSEFLFTPRLTWRLGEDRLTLEPFVSEGTEDKTETATARNTLVTTSRKTATEEKKDSVTRIGGRYDGQRDWGSWYAKAAVQETRSVKDKVEWTDNYHASTGKYTGSKRATEKETLTETANYAGAGFNMPIGEQQTVSAGVELRNTDYSSEKPKTEQSFNSSGVAGAITDKTGVRDEFEIGEDKRIIYIQDEIRIAKDHWLTPGLRYEYTAREASGDDAFGSDAQTSSNPSLHYRWTVKDNLNIRASLARTLKLPKFDQLNPAVESKSGTISNPDKGGNANLSPEEATGLEAGFEQFFWGNRGVVGVNFYNRAVKDFIEERTNLEETSSGVYRQVKRPYNVGDARFWGAEIDWRVPLIRKGPHDLVLTGNHSELRGYIDSPNQGRLDVKEMPRRVTNLGIDYKHRPTRWQAGFSVNYIPAFETSSTNDDGVVEEKTWGTRTGLDLYVGKAFSPLAELRLIARNVLSVEKQEGTIKRNTNGVITANEYKVEKSEPTVMLTFESRF